MKRTYLYAMASFLVLLSAMSYSCVTRRADQPRPVAQRSLLVSSPLASPGTSLPVLVGTLIVMDPRATPIQNGLYLVEVNNGRNQIFIIPTIDVNRSYQVQFFDSKSGRFEFYNVPKGHYHLLIATVAGVLPARSMSTGNLIFVEIYPSRTVDLQYVQIP